MNTTVTYTIPSPATEFFKVIHENFRTRLETIPSAVTTYYDTFDWRIFRVGAVLRLRHIGRRQFLTWKTREREWTCHPENNMPEFVWDLPSESMKEALRPVAKMRRFLPVVHVEESGLILHVLGPREKTLARVRLLDSLARLPGESQASPLSSTLELVPIKGYEQAFENLLMFVESELGLARKSANSLKRAVEAVGITPGDYSSKFRVELDPAMTMAEATTKILKVLLNCILVNEEGTRQALDSEFLHDFRVAVRRTRSALTQIKKVFPEKAVDHFTKEFAWLGKTTGPNRDLDVYLLKMGDYKALLPESVREDLKPLHDFLRGRQQQEHRRLVKELGSVRYKSLIEDWRNFLENPVDPEESASRSAESVSAASSKEIWKVYRKILKKGEAIDDQSPAMALHKLRIECKKLRYLLEFFRSLHDPQEIRQLIKVLRRLQDNLGDFNDYEVQQSTLKGFAQSMLKEGKGSVDTLMAMGRLIERLEAGQQRERERFSKRFSKFSSSVNEGRFRSLFSKKVTAVQ